MKAAIQLTLGTLLLLAYAGGSGLAAVHKPFCNGSGIDFVCGGWPQGRYDAVRIGSRGFLIVGLVLLAVGLISYARR